MSSLKKKYNQKEQYIRVNEQQLLDYLQGNLPPDQQHFIEEILLDDPFLSDAVDGLAEIDSKEQVRQIMTQLNLHLRRQIRERNARRKERRRFKPDKGIWMYILLLLLLIVLAWVIIEKAL